MASSTTLILLSILGMAAMLLAGFVIGRWSAIEIHREAVRGLQIIASYDRNVYAPAAARWLRRQHTRPRNDHRTAYPDGPIRPGASADTVADTTAAARRWLAKPHAALSAGLRLIQPLAPLPTPGATQYLLGFLPPNARTL